MYYLHVLTHVLYLLYYLQITIFFITEVQVKMSNFSAPKKPAVQKEDRFVTHVHVLM